MRERHERRRKDLQALRHEIDARRLVRMADGEDDMHDDIARQNGCDGREDQRQDDLEDAPAIQRGRAGRNEDRADHAADERMRRTRWHAEPPSQDAPDDRADEPRDDDVAANRLRDARRDHRADEIQDGRANDGDPRPDRTRRHARRNRVRRIMEAVDEIKRERKDDNDEDEGQIRHTSSSPL